MLYRKFPKSEDKLSILGFGCMRFPIIDGDSSKIDEVEATKMLHYAIDNGVNYIDTAYPYHGQGMSEAGQSEPFLGKALSNGYREKVKIATKLPSWQLTQKEDMETILSEQLQRLNVDCIDFYLLHALNKTYWAMYKKFGVFDFLNKAKKDGKIEQVGFSFHDNSVELFKEIVDAYDWDFCQIQYNYLDEDYQAGVEGLKYAHSKGLGLVVMEPLKGGTLVNYLPKDVLAVFLDENRERTPVDWALRWLWNHDEVAVVLSGMSSLEQVKENIQIAKSAYANSLSQSENEAINEVSGILKSKVKVGCTACGYCMPCPSGVDIPRNFAYYNDFYRFDDPKLKGNARVMYASTLSSKQKATSCVECGQCEEHCPQGIQIIDALKKVTATFQ